ncbi:MAG: hypothetical protein ABI411_20905 [Tahibacter sp.]
MRNAELLMGIQRCACLATGRDIPVSQADREPTIIASAAECAARGGTWRRVGLRATEVCFLPTKDAGKACRDDAECTSLCQAPEGAHPGEQVTGRCYGTTEVPGGWPDPCAGWSCTGGIVYRLSAWSLFERIRPHRRRCG